jgi:hypothetical protein
MTGIKHNVKEVKIKLNIFLKVNPEDDYIND